MRSKTKKEKTQGKVYLVGAGPGDPELITVRGQNLLRQADVVLYDALVHQELLTLCRPEAKLEYVGKRAGRKSERQASINAKMVTAAQSGQIVVRLKGGDPFLFGRGSEEAEVLAAASIPFEVVPGIPSPIAASAYAGISLTHRNMASSVAYLTATESIEKDRSTHDWKRLATATQTLVIFMGMRKLDTLMQLLIEHGRCPNTPAAVIQWASLPSQRTIVGTVADIAQKATEAKLGLPSLILVGNVVRLREGLRWFDTLPLFGRRIVVTRASSQADSLVSLLRAAGAQPLRAPMIRFVPTPHSPLLQNTIDQLSTYEWVLFTSQNAVDFFLHALRKSGGDARRFGTTRLCAIGPKTERALTNHGLFADFIPHEHRSEGVLRELNGILLKPARILIPRAKVARTLVPEGLRARGHHVDIVDVYETLPPKKEDIQPIKHTIKEAEVITFTSPSTVKNLAHLVSISELKQKKLVSIGKTTSQAMRELKLQVDIEANTPSIEALVDSLILHYSKRA